MTLVDAVTGEVLTECTVDEAQAMTDRMRSHRDELWRLAVESHDRHAWKALGYPTWRDYIEAEIGVKSSQAYRLLDHGRTMLALAPGDSLDSPMGERPDSPIGERVLPTHESQTRPLSRLPEDERAEAWTEAAETAAAEDRPVTARDVEEVVERRQPRTSVTERESFSRKTETEPTAKQQHDEHQATSETTWADVVAAYPHAVDVPAVDREGIRRAYVQLQTLTGPEKVKREATFLNAIDTALASPEELAARRANAEVRPLRCKSCGRPFGAQGADDA